MTGVETRAIRMLLGGVAVAFALLLSAPALTPAAEAAGPFWHVNSEVIPGNVPPHTPVEVVVTVTNQGDAASHGGLSILDSLPSGLTAKSILGNIVKGVNKVECTLATLRCNYSEPVNPYEQIAFTLFVEADARRERSRP